jgi:hypothetical protein
MSRSLWIRLPTAGLIYGTVMGILYLLLGMSAGRALKGGILPESCLRALMAFFLGLSWLARHSKWLQSLRRG